MAGMGFNDPMGGDGFYDPYAGGGFYDPYAGGGFNDPYAGGGFNDPYAGGGFNDPYAGGGFNDPYAGGGDPYYGGGFNDPGVGAYYGGDPYYEPGGYDSFFVDFQFLNDAIQDDTFEDFFASASDEFAAIQEAIAAGELTFLEFSSPTMLENDQTSVTVGASGGDGSLTFGIVGVSDGGGADAALFAINPSTGALTLADGSPLAFDFENPLDGDLNNIYELTLSVTDGVDTVTKAFSATVLDQPTVLASDFDATTGINPFDFAGFASGDAFLAAMTDGTLTWDKNFASSPLSSCDGPGRCIDVTKFFMQYKTLSQTITFGIDGTFEGVDATGTGTRFLEGFYDVDMAERSINDFSGADFVPGKFVFSNVAGAGTVTPTFADTFDITATGEASVRGASYDALSASEDISGSVQLIVEGQIATSTNGSDLFKAVGQAQIIGADGATSDVIIGVGQPAVTD
jgi:hypothetical protein